MGCGAKILPNLLGRGTTRRVVEGRGAGGDAYVRNSAILVATLLGPSTVFDGPPPQQAGEDWS